MRSIFASLLLVSICLAQTTKPVLEGTVLTIERDGRTERYKLVPQTEPDKPVPSKPQASTAVFDITQSDTIAPAGVWVNALSGPNDPLTTRYEWDFGDPKSERNKLVGFVAGHVYDQAGEYTIALTTTIEGRSSVTTKRQIRVEPDSRKAIYVSSLGDDANDGSADKPLKSLGKAGDIARDDVRLLLKRGDTFDVDQSFISPRKRVLIGAYGDAKAPKPIVRYTGETTTEALIRCTNETESLVVEQITFDSLVGNAADAKYLPHCIVAAGKQIVVRDCTFLNVSYAINGNGKPQGVIVQRCDSPNVDGLRRYLIWIEGTDWTILDNRVLNSTREHVIRGVHYQRLLIAYNDLANIDRKELDGIDIAKNTINLQAGEQAYLYGNHLSGPSSIGPLGKTDGLKYKEHRSRCYVVEANQFEKSPLEVQHGISDVMIRGNTFQIDNGRSIVVDGYDKQYDRGLANIRIVGNTAKNGGKTGGFLLIGGPVDGIWLTGNRYEAPNLQSGASQAANVYVNDRDLSSFRSIESNTWSIGKPLNFAEGGMMYVFPKWSDKQGYLDPKEWARQPQVKNDAFR